MKKVRVKIVSRCFFVEEAHGRTMETKSWDAFAQEAEDVLNELTDEGYQVEYRFEKGVDGFIFIGKLPPESPLRVVPLDQVGEDMKDQIVAYSFIEALDTLIEKGTSEKEAVEKLVGHALNMSIPAAQLSSLGDACLKVADLHEEEHRKNPGHPPDCNKPEFLRRVARTLKDALQRHVS